MRIIPWFKRKPKGLQRRAREARDRARDAQRSANAAKTEARKAAREAVALDKQAQFEEWKRIQEEQGYTVEGDSLKTARVVELPDGPTYDEKPRG